MAETSNGGSTERRRRSAGKALKRYGPILLVVIVIGRGDRHRRAAAVTTTTTSTAPTTTAGDNSDLPMTYQEAVAAGTEGDIDWGDGCDTETRTGQDPHAPTRPLRRAVGRERGQRRRHRARRDGRRDPGRALQGSARSAAAGARRGRGRRHRPRPSTTRPRSTTSTCSPTSTRPTAARCGSRSIEASGGPDDATAAQADALQVIDMEPFAVIGGPGQTPAWCQEIVAAGIVCVGCGTPRASREGRRGRARTCGRPA